MTDIRQWDDEDIDATINLGIPEVMREAARRAEIRMDRLMDVAYGDNRYGFTADNITQPHDGAWYESRQTEAEFLAEVGAN